MKDGQVKVITAAVDNRRRRIIYLVPLFLCAVAVGFLLELSTYESLNFSEIKMAIANLPQRWNQKPPSFDENSVADNNLGLQEQSENETVILEDDYPVVSSIDNDEGIQTQSQSVNLDSKTETAKESTIILSPQPPPPPPAQQEKESHNNTTKGTLQIWEQGNLLNLKTFSWLMNNESLCQLSPLQAPENTRVMPVLVHTARSHFDERLAIRRSWGSVPIYKKWDVRMVFLLGEADRGTNPEVNQKQFEEQEKMLKAEQKIFGDIVIGSFVDTYHNLTYKHLMGYKWVLEFCPNATFVMKIDDDMFIDILRWLDWRTDDLDKLKANGSVKIPDLYCHTFGGTKPMRGGKWYASKEDWPDEYYPDYCSGWAYAITVGLIQKLYSVSNNVKFFWIDDVYSTGVLMEAAKKKYKWKPEIKHIWGNVTSDIKEYRPLCDEAAWDSKREFRAVAYVPRGELFERDMMCMWNKTLHDSKYNFTLPQF